MLLVRSLFCNVGEVFFHGKVDNSNRNSLTYSSKTFLLLVLLIFGTGLLRVNMPKNQNHSHLRILQLHLFFKDLLRLRLSCCT